MTPPAVPARVVPEVSPWGVGQQTARRWPCFLRFAVVGQDPAAELPLHLPTWSQIGGTLPGVSAGIYDVALA